MNTKAIQGPQGQGTDQDGGLPDSGGNFSNAINAVTLGAAAATIGNFPQPGDASVNPVGQGNSATAPQPAMPAPPSDGNVEQYYDPGAGMGEATPTTDGLPEQGYAKPTGPWTGSALGPGMRSGG